MTNDIFNSFVDITLWFDLKQGADLTLASIPLLAQLRWPYLRDSWETTRLELLDKVAASTDPANLLQQIEDFSTLVESQRSSVKFYVNPIQNQNTFKNFFLLFQTISINSLQLTVEEQNIITSNTNRVNAFTKTNFLAAQEVFRKVRDESSDIIGGTDVDYNRIFGRSAAPTLKTKTPNDILILQNYQDGIKAVEYVLNNYFSLDTSSVDPFALAKTNANNPDYAINSSTAGSFVQLQYGENLQSLAQRLLGNPDRWIEIALANGLKPPYIDEVGEDIPLLANGANDQVNIAATTLSGDPNIGKFFINQIVFLQSNALPFPDQRTILNLKVIPVSGEIVLELSGDPDLSKFKTSENATVRIFKPNTVNSQFFLVLPTTGAVAPQPLNEVPWFLQTKKEDEKQAGVDLALDANGDLMFTSNGDLSLSYGLANAIQAAKLKFVVEQGTLNRHGDFGVATIIGAKNLDPDTLKGQLTTSIVTAIQSDPRFSAVESLSVNSITSNNASGFLVNLVVKLAGTGTSIPITFTINPN